MSQQTINIGGAANDGTGDVLRDAFDKANDNFTELYALVAASGASWKAPVRAASTANVTLSAAVENGDSLDGVTLATGDRILLKNQSTASENGIYVVATSGAPTRASDVDSGAELVNAAVLVSEGTANADKLFVCTTNAPITLGSTGLTWADFTPGGTGVPTGGTAGQVLTKQSGTDFDVDWETPVSGGSSDASTIGVTRIGSLTNWNAALARGISDPPRMLWIGDSNVAGQGSGSGTNNLTGAALTSMARQFANLCGHRIDNFMGDQNMKSIPQSMNGYDSRITLGTGWDSQTSVSKIVGGRMFQASGGATGKLRFTPAGSFDSFKLFIPQASGLNTAMTVSVDGVLVDTFSQAGSSAQLIKSYSVSHGTHYIEIGGGATGNMVVQGIVTFDSTVDTPNFIQGGWLGALMIDIQDNTNPWNSRPHAVALDPDFAVIYCTINDTETTTLFSDMYTYTETLVKALSAAGVNGCLCVGYPSNNTGSINGRLTQIADLVLKKIAIDYNWWFFDGRQTFGHSFVRAGDLGLTYDNKHPNNAGHGAFANDLYDFLTANGFVPA